MAIYDDGSKAPKQNALYTSMRGVVDFSNLAQWDLFESGYSFLGCINGPDFMKCTYAPTGSEDLLKTLILILENEFRGLDGLDDMQGETSEITDGISTINMITKVTEQSAGAVTMTYNEKSGRTITKAIELFLRGLKDSRTQAKTYNGAIEKSKGAYKADYTKEVFNFLYMVTDNTMLTIEGSRILLNAQPTKAELSILNTTRGDIGFKELGLEFNTFPVSGPKVNEISQDYLDQLNVSLVKDSRTFNWSVSDGSTTVRNIGQIDSYKKNNSLGTTFR